MLRQRIQFWKMVPCTVSIETLMYKTAVLGWNSSVPIYNNLMKTELSTILHVKKKGIIMLTDLINVHYISELL